MMPAINFQERFADMVESGEKRQTIRRVWKRPIKAGDALYLYTGMRTKRCRLLKEVSCKHIQFIKLHVGCLSLQFPYGAVREYGASGCLNQFAEKDGFKDWPEMRDWFKERYGLPFEGVLIEW